MAVSPSKPRSTNDGCPAIGLQGTLDFGYIHGQHCLEVIPATATLKKGVIYSNVESARKHFIFL